MRFCFKLICNVQGIRLLTLAVGQKDFATVKVLLQAPSIDINQKDGITLLLKYLNQLSISRCSIISSSDVNLMK